MAQKLDEEAWFFFLYIYKLRSGRPSWGVCGSRLQKPGRKSILEVSDMMSKRRYWLKQRERIELIGGRHKEGVGMGRLKVNKGNEGGGKYEPILSYYEFLNGVLSDRCWGLGCRELQEEATGLDMQWRKERGFLRRSVMSSSFPTLVLIPSQKSRWMCHWAAAPFSLEGILGTSVVPLFHGKGHWGQERLSDLPEAPTSVPSWSWPRFPDYQVSVWQDFYLSKVPSLSSSSAEASR